MYHVPRLKFTIKCTFLPSCHKLTALALVEKLVINEPSHEKTNKVSVR